MKILPVRFGMLHSSVMSFGCSRIRCRPTSSETWRAASKSIVRSIGTNTCRPGLARRLDDRLERHALQKLAQPERDFLALLERDGVELRLGALRLLARIDVRVEVEEHVIGKVEDRGFERLRASSRSRCSSLPRPARASRANARRGIRACPIARATAASAGCCTAGSRDSRPCARRTP